MRKTIPRTDVYNTLLSLRDDFLNDLANMKNPDDDIKLIIQSKVIAISQALDAFGYGETEDKYGK